MCNKPLSENNFRRRKDKLGIFFTHEKCPKKDMFSRDSPLDLNRPIKEKEIVFASKISKQGIMKVIVVPTKIHEQLKHFDGQIIVKIIKLN